ncbi:MAG TPA: glycosyltransferase family 4 protein [Gemmatimonadaceae bacterium]|nr:glycosyltransferase family 4 protein [Gemmatimonadaceae bacterium]
MLLVETNIDGTVGGSHQALLDLVRNIDHAHYTPVVLFYQNNRVAAKLRELGVEVHVWEGVAQREWEPLPSGAMLAKARKRSSAIRRRVRFLRDTHIALVHINNSPGSSWFDWLPAARLAGIPCVAHARATTTAPRSFFERAFRQRYDGVLAISDYVAETLERAGMPRNRIHIVYDGIDAQALLGSVRRTREEVRSELGIADDKLLVTMVGHLRPWKGQEVVLAALNELAPPLRDQLRVLFVGGIAISSEAYAEALQATIDRSGLAGIARLLGERSDAPDLMNAADIVLHASTAPEPFGLVVVEGMVLGKAVVASGLGGPTEVITPGSGITFDPGNPRELANVLASLIGDRTTLRSLGENAKRRALDFTAQKTAAAVERVYGALLR